MLSYIITIYKPCVKVFFFFWYRWWLLYFTLLIAIISEFVSKESSLLLLGICKVSIMKNVFFRQVSRLLIQLPLLWGKPTLYLGVPKSKKLGLGLRRVIFAINFSFCNVSHFVIKLSHFSTKYLTYVVINICCIL